MEFKIVLQKSTTLYRASSKHLYSQIDAEAVILDINSGTYYGLNEVSNRVWQLLQVPTSEDRLLELLLEEYEVTPEKASADLQDLLQDLSSNGLVEVVNEEVARV